MNLDRRTLLKAAASYSLIAGPLGGHMTALAQTATSTTLPPKTIADFEALYEVDRSLINLENGYWGIMAQPVLQSYQEAVAYVNRSNTIYARSAFGGAMKQARLALAQAVGADEDEIALTRNATEALQSLIAGYNRLQPGDAVLYSDLDYDSMQYAMNWLQQRRGVTVRRFSIPEPASYDNILAAYRKIMDETPNAKLLLLTHLSHRTGLVLPVREIIAMARERSIDTIVDAAHSFGQMDFKIADIDADFIGFNAHKWIGAPVGVGFMYIRKNCLSRIDRHYGDEDYPESNIRSRIHTGTLNFAAIMAVPTAVAVHEKMTAKAKEARLRGLRDHWVNQVQTIDNIEILTPDDKRLYAGITSLRLKNAANHGGHKAIVGKLRDEHRILTVQRSGVTAGDCIRITPALYTRENELDQFVTVLKTFS